MPLDFIDFLLPSAMYFLFLISFSNFNPSLLKWSLVEYLENIEKCEDANRHTLILLGGLVDN